MNPEHFPFSVWASLSRSILNDRKDELMTVSPSAGVLELREAIANHLKSFRGMLVDPNQIIVGAGTEYLYGLLTKLLGTDAIYAIENPGYKKLKRPTVAAEYPNRFLNEAVRVALDFVHDFRASRFFRESGDNVFCRDFALFGVVFAGEPF